MKHIIEEASKRAQEFDLKESLVVGIIATESNWDHWATRYEPEWSYFHKTNEYAKKLHISNATERVHQATSWGAMQVMGTVARELGFWDHLPKLCLVENGIYYGCKKLASLFEKYGYLHDVIAAYNAGSVRKNDENEYVNQHYVDRVMSAMSRPRED